jgi:5-methylcytosine-specific restriction endonuclease McrA
MIDASKFDHIVPVARGGEGTEDNCAAVCKNCHLSKSSAEAAQGA